MKMLNTTSIWKAGFTALFSLLCLGAWAQTTVTFSSASAPASIPDGAYNGTLASMATKTLNVSLPAGQLISNIRVFVNVSHDATGGAANTDNCSGGDGASGWVGDMTMKMQLPNGNIFGLMSRPGLAETVDGAGQCCGNSADLLKSAPDLIFSDAAAISSEGMGGAGTTDGLGNVNVFTYAPSKGIISSPYTTFASITQALCTTENLNGTWTLGVGDGALFDAGCFTSWTLEVTYAAACDLVVPSNVTVNLDPGACSQILNYNVSTTGNCVLASTLQGWAGQFAPTEVDVVQNDAIGPAPAAPASNANPPAWTNNYSTTFTPNANPVPTGLRLISADFGQSAGPNLWFYNGVEWVVNQNTTLSFNWTYATNDGAFWDRFVYRVGTANNGFGNNNFGNQIGNWTNIHNQNGGLNQNGTFSINLTAGQRFAIAAYTVDANFGPATINISNVTANAVIPAVPVLISGLPSGGDFPIGTTTNCYRLDYTECGVAKSITKCFNVTVLEFPNPITSLICNDLVYFSVDEDCVGCVGADDVLEGGPYGCYDDYIVELDKTAPFGNGPWVPACYGPADIGKTYQVRVTDPTTGNKCWGNIKFEDKLAPVITCCDITIPCNASTAPTFAADVITATGKSTAPVNVLDNQTVTSTLNFPACGDGNVINDVNVSLNITHTWIGDLDVILESPEGTQVKLWDNSCNTFDNLIFTADDEAAVCSNACADYALGLTLRPISCLGLGTATLADFDGENPAGTWRLIVNDNAAGDQGIINNFSVQINFNAPAGAVPAATVADNCGAYTLTYIDSEVAGNCATGLSKTIQRKWTATDASGNTSTCIQNIGLVLPTFDDLVAPPDYDDIDAPAFHCTDNAYPTPQWIEGVGLQGFPYVFGEPVGCTINWEYEDIVIDVCDGTYKIRRRWTIIDWCIGDGFEYNQIIKVLDDQGPEIACPANLTVSTDPFTCCATVNLPDVIIEDNCSRINNISGMIIGFDQYTGEQIGMFNIGGSLTSFPGNNFWDLDTLGAFGWTPCLPVGTHTVIYQAQDDCGNTSTCSFRLTVRDYIPPVAACDEYTVVAIGVDDPFDCYGPAGQGNTPPALGACEFAGVTWVKASTFDDGSYDNCNSVKFTVRRMAPYSDCINALNAVNGTPACDDLFQDFPSEFERAINEQDSIKFYCCEVGTTQTVILSVYQIDVNGNFSIGPDGSPIKNECMVQVEVQDKIKPACVPPANVTVTCDNFDPSLWAYGKASVYDNCCLDVTKEYQGQCGLTHSVNYSLFDTLCNKGTITRTFRAFDCHGFSSQCTQRVVVNYKQDYYVRFPNDVIVSTCDGTGNYGAPTFFGEDCELLGVSFEDQVFTVVPDACYKIERTWTIINWCTYNPNLGCINVPNPNPNAITNHPTNLPGPTVSAAGTAAPWNPTVVKINPTDATATNYSVYYDANANCYKYKQIIKVIDTQDPTVQCPASPVEYCDLSANDPQLWNEMYWWDNVISSHDLCEGETDLSITATDACSGSNINFRYLLFLDLDGDGVMETVVSSTNLPGVNNVQYGNASNPNYTGGTSRAFDGRPVPFNQKWRFNIDWTTSGTSATAKVRFDNLQSQIALPNAGNNTMQGVVPQLPYGTHKIKWFIEDNCGNESICEYTFVVKDCKKPTVVCLNGLSVNIMPTQMITLWASDFLQYTEDNCTPAGQLKIGIRKSDTGTGFPVDANGNPITNVTFTCDELGTQYVELWSIDAAGNADFCETYVIVQDNMGNCPNGTDAKVAGALATDGAAGLEEASVNIAGSSNAVPSFTFTTTTNDQGNYNFNAIPMASNSTITPTKDDNPLNGVSTYDLVLMSKHILGIEPLNTPYKMIAADVNKSGSITNFDIVEARKLILGIYNEFPNNTSWRQVDKAFVFPNPSNPFQTVFPETKSILNLTQNQLAQDFVSVKVGDVNGTAIANSLQQTDDRSAGTLLFDVQDRNVKAGEVVDVTFTAAEKVQGYQFTLNFAGLEAIDVVPGAGMKADNFGVFADAITTSFDGEEKGEFTVRFRAMQNGQLSKMLGVSSRITKAEAYNNDARQDVAFRFNNGGVATISGVGFELYQNQPNPFVNKTFIGFHLPEATEATLSIYDETGRLIFNQRGDFAKGYNTIAIDRALLNTTGVLYYQLQTNTDSATKKMIQTK